MVQLRWRLLAAVCAVLLGLTGCDSGDGGGGGGTDASSTSDTTNGTNTCTPSCGDRVCGDDGCGSVCGECTDDLLCSAAGACLSAADCVDTCEAVGATCGTICGTSCGTCAAGEVCAGGQCEALDTTPTGPTTGCDAVANCAGKTCGDDGCGGVCGTCDAGTVCNATGACLAAADCTDTCDGAQCGTVCGIECGACGEGEACSGTTCVCAPSCAGKTCGDDGCGGNCGSCGAGDVCDANGVCIALADCTDTCASTGAACGTVCGESCGVCAVNESCEGGTCACTPNCVGKTCGDDGCGGDCGTCDAGLSCDATGQCVCVAQCDDKDCGDDGCGGDCGTCDAGLSCDAAGQCGCPAGEVARCALDLVYSPTSIGQGVSPNLPVCADATLLGDGTCEVELSCHQGDGGDCCPGQVDDGWLGSCFSQGLETPWLMPIDCGFPSGATLRACDGVTCLPLDTWGDGSCDDALDCLALEHDNQDCKTYCEGDPFGGISPGPWEDPEGQCVTQCVLEDKNPWVCWIDEGDCGLLDAHTGQCWDDAVLDCNGLHTCSGNQTCGWSDWPSNGDHFDAVCLAP
ncbi:MAG: hypothetical protein QF464_01360 [Myxococcota bacterium]|nr:hypothetical protein [Myxococcota bacterium]